MMTECSRRILLVYPRFAANRFMGHYELACELVGARQILPPLGLLTVAAMLPPSWEVRLIDRNLAVLNDADIEWADLVMTGGMLSQQGDTLEVITRVQELERPVVVGGPDISSSPAVYRSADYAVIGEAEGTLELMLAAWQAGEAGGVFEREKFSADVSSSPTPRFDLIDPYHYMQVGVQFSRGCPFTCEFCDIIELYGRVPRTKTIEQVLAELDALHARGYRGLVYFVDDNLIGNKKALRPLLREITAWQAARRFPFQFYTAASLNLADDSELLAALRDANFMSVFIGIETGDPKLLADMRKKQNTRRSIADSVSRIQQAGLFVTAGFIVGLDNENSTVVEEMVELIESSAISLCFVSLLYALPNTQLSRRLAQEGRLGGNRDISRFEEASGSCLTGLNFETQRPRAEIIADFANVLSRLYDRHNFFRRLESAIPVLKPRSALGSSEPKAIIADLRRWAIFTWNLHRKYPELAIPFWSLLGKALIRNPRSLKAVLIAIGMYPHMRLFAANAVREVEAEARSAHAMHGFAQPFVAADDPVREVA